MIAETVMNFLPAVAVTVPGIGVFDLAPYLGALIVFGGLTIFFRIILAVIVNRLQALSQKTSTDVDDVVIAALQAVNPWAYSYVAFYVAILMVPTPDWLEKALTVVFLLVVVKQAIDIAARLTEYGVTRFVEKDEDGDGEVDPGAATASNMITLMARITLWAFGGLFILSNLGVEITSLIAGLGVGGIAIAFALQGILTDLFASFSIYFDRPFRIGDYIVIGTDSGIVEKIGIKSTRIRTLQGEELVVSNTELTSARVNNFKKMEKRRIVTQFGITYETPQDRVQQVPGMVERMFAVHDKADLDRVHFTTFGDSALIFEMVYFIDSAVYTDYLDIQQAVNFDMMKQFAEVGIDFAYPTQTVYHKAV